MEHDLKVEEALGTQGVKERAAVRPWGAEAEEGIAEAEGLEGRICELTGGGQCTSQADGHRAQRGLFLPLLPPRMLRNNRIGCIHNDSFTGLRNVRLLSLYDNQIATISPGAFDTLQALSTL